MGCCGDPQIAPALTSDPTVCFLSCLCRVGLAHQLPPSHEPASKACSQDPYCQAPHRAQPHARPCRLDPQRGPTHQGRWLREGDRPSQAGKVPVPDAGSVSCSDNDLLRKDPMYERGCVRLVCHVWPFGVLSLALSPQIQLGSKLHVITSTDTG